ncbi:hypothetical protein L596_002565 [Steinernema carpocapsae]|uniref:Uncharacterized protein n=1 Tax=Steinernema carpocapsae TaxID=34508 RepID=A0A4U8URH0_STECR|nr:hypothetical protein L596_002565 [Steinernema carpocapsae]
MGNANQSTNKQQTRRRRTHVISEGLAGWGTPERAREHNNPFVHTLLEAVEAAFMGAASRPGNSGRRPAFADRRGERREQAEYTKNIVKYGRDVTRPLWFIRPNAESWCQGTGTLGAAGFGTDKAALVPSLLAPRFACVALRD